MLKKTVLMLFSLFLLFSCNSSNNNQLNDQESITADSINPESYYVVLKYSDLKAKTRSSYSSERDSSVVILRDGGVFSNITSKNIVNTDDDFLQDGDVVIINGVNEDRMGYNQSYSNNGDTFLDVNISPFMFFDIYDLNNGDLSQSVSVDLEYDPSLIEEINQQIVNAGGNNWIFIAESDLGVYKLNKQTGLWVECNNNVTQNEEQNYFTLTIDVEGVYCYSYKQTVGQRVLEYMEQNPTVYKNLLNQLNSIALDEGQTEESDKVSESLQTKAIPYTSGAKEFPTDEFLHCSDIGVVPELLYLLTFSHSCETHDWCYRYGNVTYGHDKKYCDTHFKDDLFNACNQNPENPNEKWVWKNLWFCRAKCPNPKWWAFEAIVAPARLACKGTAETMYLAVKDYGSDAYDGAQKIAGCYDYKEENITCSAFRDIAVTDSSSAPVFPDSNATDYEKKAFHSAMNAPTVLSRNNSYTFYIHVVSNVHVNHAETIQYAKWTINSNTAGSFDATNSNIAISDTNSIAFTPSENAAAGQYTIRVTLFGDNDEVMGEALRSISIPSAPYTYESFKNTLDILEDGKYFYVKGNTPTCTQDPFAEYTESKSEVLDFYKANKGLIHKADILLKDLSAYSNVGTLYKASYMPYVQFGDESILNYYYTTYSYNDPSISCLEATTANWYGYSMTTTLSQPVITVDSTTEALHPLWGSKYQQSGNYVANTGNKVVAWLPRYDYDAAVKNEMIAAIESAPSGSLFWINNGSGTVSYPYRPYTSSKSAAIQWVKNFNLIVDSTTTAQLAEFRIIPDPMVQKDGMIPLYKCRITSPLGSSDLYTTNLDNDCSLVVINNIINWWGYENDKSVTSEIIGYVYNSKFENSQPIYGETYIYNGSVYSTGQRKVIGYTTRIY